MKNPDAKVLVSLKKLASPEFKPFRDWLETGLQDYYHTLSRSPDDRVIAQHQGRAQEIVELLALIEKAPGISK
jgi:hypothetical protein